MRYRFPKNVLRERLKRFQRSISDIGIDAVMLRTLSSFIYFTGVKWLRPALLIPSNGDPIAFIAMNEEDGFLSRTWVRNFMTYSDGGSLIANVTRTIRENGYKVIGLEYGIERDAYILFYEMFKRLNPRVKVVDVSGILAEMKMIKDRYEIESIRKAGEICSKAMEKILSIIEEGISETEIAGEAYNILYKLGSEEPHVYINVGPNPRIHAEPFRDNRVKKGLFVTVIIGADYNRYYANMSRTIFTGEPDNKMRKAIECMKKVYEIAVRKTRAGVKFIDVIKILDKVYSEYNLIDHRVVGYIHGVGLQIEEPPITTILPRDRFMKVRRSMALALVHSPLMIKKYGQVKIEDTFIVKENGELEKVT